MILHTHAPEAHAHARVSPCADEWPLAHPVLELHLSDSSSRQEASAVSNGACRNS